VGYNLAQTQQPCGILTTEVTKLPKVKRRNVCTIHKKDSKVNVIGKSLQMKPIYISGIPYVKSEL
jgi:hypothetical protein